MSYRGPQFSRQVAQFSGIAGYAGETATWVRYISAAAQTSAYWAGGGETLSYTRVLLTALFAAPGPGQGALSREYQLPGGTQVAGDAVVSTTLPLGLRDEIEWRGVTYRVDGDSTPVHFGGRTWYRTVLRRGDATG